MPERPPIPAELKREVRQRCGFGCVICGSPIYDYDHIEEFSLVKEHTFENLTLLCPLCHRKKTKGLITKQMVLTAVNQVDIRGRTSPDEIPSQSYSLEIGRNVIKNFSGLAFSILNFGTLEILFKGKPVINAEILNENGDKAIEIKENNYTLCSSTWDIEYVGTTLTFRNGPREIFASITFDVKQKTIKLSGIAELRNGIKIKIGDHGIWANQLLLAGFNLIESCSEGLIITNKPIQLPVAICGAHVRDCKFNGLQGIAIANSTNCKYNTVGACRIGFLWTESYLDQIKNCPS
ncbi:MAG: HNH endonuclease [Nitrospirales bacterium]